MNDTALNGLNPLGRTATSGVPAALGVPRSAIVVCVNWVDLHPEIDLIDGSISTDRRRYGFSEADRAALEVGLGIADRDRGDGCDVEVVVMSVAPSAADDSLIELAASGADRIVRIDGDPDGDPALSAAAVGRALAHGIEAIGDVSLVVCGDLGFAWGSGAVPGYIAHHLEVPQALGALEVSADVDAVGAAKVGPGELSVLRRLDGGRRELLRVPRPAVVSVEGAAARLRRAPLRSVMELRRRGISADSACSPMPSGLLAEHVGPIRPRARVLAPPGATRALDRIAELTGAFVDRNPPRTVEAEPAEAAALIVEQLRTWGYLTDDPIP